jgi:uncharacterized protein YbjT (DUF2867 family)
VARNFVKALEATDCRRIIYLGGLIDDPSDLSPHLRSRLEVEEVLRGGAAKLTALRASIIVGSGSASFEIVRDLAEKLPVMVAPRWVNTRCHQLLSHIVRSGDDPLECPECAATMRAVDTFFRPEEMQRAGAT